MKTILINCKFAHYPDGYYQVKEHFALFIQISNPTSDIREEIVKTLKELNFNLGHQKTLKEEVNMIISFTAQPINLKRK
jgi:hypothetical protein